PSPTHYGNDFLLNEASIREIICQTSIDNLDVIYADPDTKLGEGLLDHSRNRHDRITEKFLELRENLEQLGYQRIMLDTTPSLTLMSVSSLLVADAILVVHIPALHTLKTAVHTLLAVYGLLEKSLDRSFFLVYNQVPPTPSEEIEQIINQLTTEFQKHIQIEVLGRIPLETTGKLLVNPLLLSKASPILKHLQPIVERLFEPQKTVI
ncbi:MAG: ParA family protein, partial [Candidatus Hodarchaeota archaeon]